MLKIPHDGSPNTQANEKTVWSSSTLFCTMHSGYTCSDGGACPEFYDGLVGFHYETLPDGSFDSEYLTIRSQADPLVY
jgi:hypothetical protein